MAFFIAAAHTGLPPTPFDQAIEAATRGDWQLETLVRAVITRESGWQPSAVNPEPGSPRGPSYGLMQVTLPTARLFDPTIQADDLLDPWLNVAVGTEYLRDLLARYGTVGDAVAAYNAGSPKRDASGKYLNEGYVSDVIGYYVYYQNNLPPVATADAAPATGDVIGIAPRALAGAGGLLLLAAGAAFALMRRRR